jgi:hypothetical protein
MPSMMGVNTGDAESVLSVTAVTTTQTSPNQFNGGARGAYIIVNVGTLTGSTPTLLLTANGIDLVSNKPYLLFTATATIGAAGTTVYLIYPYTPAALTGTNITQAIGVPLPYVWNVVMTAGGTITNATYTVAASYLL